MSLNEVDICENCGKEFPVDLLCSQLDSSDSNRYLMCPTCKSWHQKRFQQELEQQEAEDLELDPE